MTRKLYFTLFAALFLVQCKTLTPSTDSSKSTEQEEFTPTVVTLILRAYKGEPELKMEKIIRSKGWLKDEYSTNIGMLKEDEYVFSFLDKEGNTLKAVQLPTPLTQRYEYSKEDGTLDSKTVEKDTEVLSLRTLDDGKIALLKIEIVQKGKRQFLQNILIE